AGLLPKLSPDPELPDDRAVAPDVVAAQVVQQPAPLANQEEEAAARVVVFRVRLQVLGQLRDTRAEDSHLDFWRTRIRLVKPVLRDQISLDSLLDCQNFFVRKYTHAYHFPLHGRRGYELRQLPVDESQTPVRTDPATRPAEGLSHASR